ncbi:hypothetical protein L6164_012259 [Bauhinia variegata]|uniref:Uncharacterized protein n=1 Tax=Bauhinia variegata TaxID=167791 RepID=A0ACB9P9P9_BAUVA|nr:hypothetical protein L6164_012259 [Bauhinia variegata]
MHDLIRDMGREIIRQVSPLELGKRSRLWFHEDVLEVLIQNTGNENIEGILLDLPKPQVVHWSGTAFEQMKSLRVLVIRNAKFSIGPKYLPNNLRLFEWMEYPSKALPPGFDPKKLVVFNYPAAASY